MREWIKHFPGSRPWAWWQYDSPGLRKQVGGQRLKNMKKEYWQISSKGNTDGFETKIQSSFGIPEILDLDKGKNLIFESQAAFLARYGLLSKSEQKRLKPADFRPELTKK
ncbi:MAG: hypothetical protein KQH63_18480 [Desulfobulbaceae bacterium]|nr:hypothetical protein [Desulfobulbaceae bacterium]